jgi:hypothetical protein
MTSIHSWRQSLIFPKTFFYQYWGHASALF